MADLNRQNLKGAFMKTALCILALLSIFLALPVLAQDQPSVLVGGGISYNSDATQSYSGTFFFSKNLDESRNTYSISFVDAYPVLVAGKLKFNATSIQTGIARKLITIGNQKIYGLFDAGVVVGEPAVKPAISYGVALPVKLVKSVYIIPTARALYNGISETHGVILGFNIAFGAK
jgi:hypothetical protein